MHIKLQYTGKIAALCIALLLACTANPTQSEEQPAQSKSNETNASKQESPPKVTSHPANRLSRETSPYLLLHAHNPVDWYAWGPEAFEKARKENKPIFLSVGYSSCYWCHVMERLVFENEEIAKLMNEHFVNIKVDREERPDVDDIYMTSLQVYHRAIGSAQGGGWPLSMFLTPAGKPFAGGTYFPPKSQHGRPGFGSVVKNVHEQWSKQQQAIEKTAEVITTEVQRVMKPRLQIQPVALKQSLVEGVTASILETYDAQYGGIDFYRARPDSPKFPTPTKLAYLQYDLLQHPQGKSAEALYNTLDHIADGGIRDHLGGGFHRYSTDRTWHVPHFEKMLYDQAQLADVYTEAFRQTKNDSYKDIAEGIFQYVLQKMTNSAGGFYSALDAETDGVEGSYYVWSRAEVSKLLDKQAAALFSDYYGLNQPQTFEHGYVLHITQPLEKLAKTHSLSIAAATKILEESRKQLLQYRSKRPKLLLDDKVLTSWNGLMIRALANGGAVFKNEEYIQAAEKCANFILSEMRDDKGHLQRTWRDERSKLNAYVDDYAFFIDGLLALHAATGNQKWLDKAVELNDAQHELFWDKTAGGYFFTSHHHEELIARTKNAYDAVLPAGNSVSARNLIRLAELTGKEKYREQARRILNLFAINLKESPRGSANMALALAQYLSSDKQQEASPVEKTSAVGETQEFLLVSAESKPKEKQPKKKAKVTVKAYLSVDRLPAGGKCKIVVYVDIVKGWHINTNPSYPKYLKPTVLKVTSKLGTKISKVVYPKGIKLKMEMAEEAYDVYEKRLTLFGELTIPASAAGKTENIEIQVQYQPCDHVNCLRPTVAKLKGKLPVAKVNEPVKQINGKLFEKPKPKKLPVGKKR